MATKKDEKAEAESTPPTVASEKTTKAATVAPRNGRIPDGVTGPIDRAHATLQALKEQETVEVYVPYSRDGNDPEVIPADAEVVTLAMINGVRFTCQRGHRRDVPYEVACIAHQAGVTRSGPPRGYAEWARRRTTGEPLPTFRGAPTSRGSLGAATLDA